MTTVIAHWRPIYRDGNPGPWIPGEPPDITADAVERIERAEFVPAEHLQGAVDTFLHDLASARASRTTAGQDTIRLLAGLLRAHYGTAVEKAGWTPGWEDDAERILEALDVVPASRDTLNATEDATCGRLLVGQGDDTYDPACALPRGHSGVCRPDTPGEKPAPTLGGSEAPSGASLDGLSRGQLEARADVLDELLNYAYGALFVVSEAPNENGSLSDDALAMAVRARESLLYIEARDPDRPRRGDASQ